MRSWRVRWLRSRISSKDALRSERKGRTINPERLLDSTEHPLLEHLQASHRESLAPPNRLASVLGLELPHVPRSSIHQHAHEHEIHHPPRYLHLSYVLFRPSLEERVDATPDKMPPASVWGDGNVVGAVVARDERADKVNDGGFLGEVEVPVVEPAGLGELEDAGATCADAGERAEVYDLGGHL